MRSRLKNLYQYYCSLPIELRATLLFPQFRAAGKLDLDDGVLDRAIEQIHSLVDAMIDKEERQIADAIDDQSILAIMEPPPKKKASATTRAEHAAHDLLAEMYDEPSPSVLPQRERITAQVEWEKYLALPFDGVRSLCREVGLFVRCPRAFHESNKATMQNRIKL